MLAGAQLHAPHLIDSEMASGLRRQVSAAKLSPRQGWAALDAGRRLGMTKYPVDAVLDRVWELRDNLSAYDAGYVALAERLECSLLTADHRLSRVPGLRCPITVI